MQIFKLNKNTETYKVKTDWIKNTKKRNEIFRNFINENFHDNIAENKISPSTDYSALFFEKDLAKELGLKRFVRIPYQYQDGELMILKSGDGLFKKYSKHLKDSCVNFEAPLYCFMNYDLPQDVRCSTSYNPISENLYLLIDSQTFKAGYELLQDTVKVSQTEYDKDMEVITQ